ncbi:MAG: hypothetical protein JNN18_09820 [Rubrivivax sp.]|nr:hypothetical protein [Rubrivivax sp.]
MASTFAGHSGTGASWEGHAVTKSMRIAIDDVRLDALYVVHQGRHRCELEAGIEAVPLWSALTPA